MAFASDIRTGGFEAPSFFVSLRNAAAHRRARLQKFRKTKNELESLSSRELADIGITAGDIKRIAMEASMS